MIGDEYLQIRARLGTALFSLSTLAHGIQAGHDVLQSLQDLRASLREPFLLMVLGEAKSGRSSLVNALLGREIFSSSTPPATDKVHLYKYGSEDKSVDINHRLTECYQSNTVLRDFNVIDTPATSAITVQQQAVIEQFLPAADLVLYVFSITNPWAPSAWEFLKTVHRNPCKNVVFVLQQCDLRNDTEVLPVLHHLEQTLREKYSPDARIFAISAKKAYLSRTTGADKEGLLQQSNIAGLESYIDDTVSSGEERLGTLRSVCHTAQLILLNISEKARSGYYTIDRDSNRLSGMYLAVEDRKEQSLRHVTGISWTLAQSYERMQKRGEQLLQQHLSYRETSKFLFKGGSRQEKLLQTIDPELQASIRRQIASSIELLEIDLQDLLQQMHEYARKQFSTPINTEYKPEFLPERTRLLEAIEAAFVGKDTDAFLKEQMRAFFNETATWLKIPPEEGMAAIIDALTAVAIRDFSQMLTEAAATSGVSAIVKRGRILMQFRAGMAHRREELLAALEHQMRPALDRFYKDATGTFQDLEHFSATQRAIYEPRIASVTQIEESFGKVGASLGLPALE